MGRRHAPDSDGAAISEAVVEIVISSDEGLRYLGAEHSGHDYDRTITPVHSGSELAVEIALFDRNIR
jgi:hypothetical protein